MPTTDQSEAHLSQAKRYCQESGATTDQVQAVALVSIAQSLSELVQFANRLSPMLKRIEDGIKDEIDGAVRRSYIDGAKDNAV